VNHYSWSRRVQRWTEEWLLWGKTEWRFLLALSVGAIAVSFALAVWWDEPLVFSRSGALMTIAGANSNFDRARFGRAAGVFPSP
jgi:hypothetical protein